MTTSARTLLTLLCLFFLLAGTAMGQEASGKLIQSHSFSLYFDTHIFRFSNGDLRATDTSSLTAVQNTDDEILIGYFELGTIFKAKLKYDILFYVDLYKVGYWGNDSPEFNTPAPVYLRHLFFSVPLKRSADTQMHLTVGRSRFALFPEQTLHNNYILADNIDAVVLSLARKKWGLESFVDLFSMNGPVTSIYELRADQHEDTVDGFNGDVNILRFAFLPWFRIGSGETGMVLRPFFLFSRIGATGGSLTSGGAEQSEGGTSGNEADNDWLMVAGGSLKFNAGKFSFLGEAAISLGKDRKSVGIPDVNIAGVFFHASAVLNLSEKTRAGIAALYASGASTDANGNYENYGYTGFKADKLGGFLFREYYGVYPYAVLDTHGIAMDPVASSRRAPAAAAVLRFETKEHDLFKRAGKGEGFNCNLEAWLYLDTSSSGTDYTSGSLPGDAIDHRRFGKFMGYEIDVKVSYTLFGGMLETGLLGGIFVPYDFYLLPASDQTAPYGKDIFWGLALFAKLRF